MLHVICSCFYCHRFLTSQRPLTTHLAVQLSFPAWSLQLLTSLVSAFLFLRFDHSRRINNTTLMLSGPRGGTALGFLALLGSQSQSWSLTLAPTSTQTSSTTPTVAAETHCLYAHVWIVSGHLHTDKSAQHHSPSGRSHSACSTQCFYQRCLHTTLGF